MFWVLMVGCGGGLRDGKLLRDLDKDEARELCGEYSEEKTATCKRDDAPGAGSVEVTVGGTQCPLEGGGDAVLPSCGATVEDYRACMDALFEDPCLKVFGLPGVCNWQRDCIIEDTDDTGA